MFFSEQQNLSLRAPTVQYSAVLPSSVELSRAPSHQVSDTKTSAVTSTCAMDLGSTYCNIWEWQKKHRR